MGNIGSTKRIATDLKNNQFDKLINIFKNYTGTSFSDDFAKSLELSDEDTTRYAEVIRTAFNGISKDSSEMATDVKKNLDGLAKSGITASVNFKQMAKNIASTAGVMIAIKLAVWAATEAWDKINVTVAESKEELDKLNSSLETLQSEYDTLSSRNYDSLSDSEKERLNYLEGRIKLEKELIEIQKHKVYKEQLDTGFTSLFDEDSFGYEKEFNRNEYQTTAIGDIQTTTKADKIDKAIEKYQTYQEAVNKAQESLENLRGEEGRPILENSLQTASNKMQNAESELQGYLEDIELDMAEYQENVDKYQAMIDSGTLTVSETRQAENAVAFWKTRLESAQKFWKTRLKSAQKYPPLFFV